MDMYDGRPGRFYVSGMLGTSRLLEHVEDAWNYFYRGLISLVIVARALGDQEADEHLSQYLRRFEAASGRSL